MSKVAYIISNDGTINIVKDGKAISISIDHTNYAQIRDALKCKAYDSLDFLVDISQKIEQSANESTGGGQVTIKNGLIYYNNFIVDNSLTRRILEMIKLDYPFQPMINFLENLMQNPSARAIQELYSFLEVNNLPITESGKFLAYKRIQKDWKDFYTSTLDNSIGAVVTMPRHLVVEDKNQTCQSGLHVCSREYLANYHGGQGRIIIVEINPRDVVSVPVDYNNTKMRVCEYTVIAETDSDVLKNEVEECFDQPVYDTTITPVDDGFGIKPSGQKFHNIRGNNGKFVRRNT